MKDQTGAQIAFDRGFAILELRTWKQFEDFISKTQNLKGYIFRGHRCGSSELVPTLVRLLKAKGKSLDAKELGQHLLRFRLAIRGRINLPERTNALNALDAANINYLSLFPDVERAAQFANTKL